MSPSPLGRPALVPGGPTEADRADHVLVDGAPRERTVLLCSHWPGGDPPAALRRDTSTEMALAVLATPGLVPPTTRLAALDHLDEDGLAALYVLCRPDEAAPRASCLAGLARLGDFDVVEEGGPGDGARVGWALRRLLDPARSPLAGIAGIERPRLATALLEGLLATLDRLLAEPATAAALAEPEEAAAALASAALAGGAVLVEERPQAHLAVVRVDPAVPPGAAGTLGQGRLNLPVHPAALHAATAAVRILVVHGGRCTYYDRYETWVAYASRPLPARRDLTLLAARLDERERCAGAWRATPASAPVAVLEPAPGRASRLAPDEVVEALVAHLGAAPPAWLPGAPAPAGPSGAGARRSAAPTAGTSGRAPARWRGRRPAAPSA